MMVIGEKKNILWDFDGVIMDSMIIREKGFREVLSDYPEEQVEQLIHFHKENGGLSRYVKFRRFLKNIRGEEDVDQKVKEFSKRYSKIMKQELIFPELLITDTINFIQDHFEEKRMHVVSGSDGEELRFLCDKLKLSPFFVSIEGSPTPKIDIVKNLLLNYTYRKEETCLIGDSINDFEAAEVNGIDFYGYNNIELKDLGRSYISFFKNIFGSEN